MVPPLPPKISQRPAIKHPPESAASPWIPRPRTRGIGPSRLSPWTPQRDFPIKPGGQPDAVTTKPPAAENILTALSQQAAVLRGTGPAADKAVVICWVLHLISELSGSPDESSAPALSGDYVKAAKKVAERRVLLAGYRMAAVLKMASR